VRVVDGEEGQAPPVQRAEGRARVGEGLADEEGDNRREQTLAEAAHTAGAIGADAGVAGADDHVGLSGDQRLEDHAKLARVVLAVAVDLHGDVEAVRERVAEPGLHGAADSKVEGNDQKPGTGCIGDRPGPVVGAVVHDDDLEARIRCPDLLDHSPDRACLVYDCLYPYTVGGAERWYRALAERLAVEGYEVTYLTLRQWDEGDEPNIPRVRIVAAGPRSDLYVDGRRRIGPALRFGLGVLRHLLRDGRRYDVVHSGSSPFFPLLAAGLARRGRYRLLVDWIEVWTLGYWRSYLGWLKGTIAWAIQRFATRVGERAFCFSRLHERRLLAEGFRGPVEVIGVYTGPLDRPKPEPAEPVVVFVGRHIPEKGVLALPPALARARETFPELRAEILGDGPLRTELERLVAEAGLHGAVALPGFVPEDHVRNTIRRGLCLALPSTREGYGLVVVEAASQGVPSVVVQSPDNAALELLEDGVNGVVARSTEPDELAGAILRVHEGGAALRTSTADWFVRNGRRLSLEASLETVMRAYGRS
jgi:glycosyltransferase involved in cell wall biosynthesis